MKKFKVLVLLFFVPFVFSGCGANSQISSVVNKDVNSRYEIYGSDYMIVLLDKRTGTTWRNVHCDDKDKVPNCWQSMDFLDVKPLSDDITPLTNKY